MLKCINAFINSMFIVVSEIAKIVAIHANNHKAKLKAEIK